MTRAVSIHGLPCTIRPNSGRSCIDTAVVMVYCPFARGDLNSDLIGPTWFLGPTRVHIPNGRSIGSAVSEGLTIMTDRQTDRQTDRAAPSVTIGRIYVL